MAPMARCRKSVLLERLAQGRALVILVVPVSMGCGIAGRSFGVRAVNQLGGQLVQRKLWAPMTWKQPLNQYEQRCNVQRLCDLG
jgi:hypothetical protein